MAQSSIPVRFRFRSDSMVPLLTIMAGARLWEEEGIDVRELTYSDDPLSSEDLLMAGDIDFVFGNHVSPYARLAQGYPLVCLAQTENWDDIWVATAPEITALPMLRGKRVVAMPLRLEDGEFAGHANGSRLLVLELQGVDTRELDYVRPESVPGGIEAVRDGQAEACFISSERAERAAAAGLRVHELPLLPMVHSITFTTTLPRVLRQPELAERVIRVLARAVHYFKTRREDTLRLLEQPVHPLSARRRERIAARYAEHAADYEARLFPRPEAIVNVHKLCCMAYPEARTVNPMELWDLHPLRLVHSSGFVDRLYQNSPAPAEHAATR